MPGMVVSAVAVATLSLGISGKRGLVGGTCNQTALFSSSARTWSYNYGVNRNEFSSSPCSVCGFWPNTSQCNMLAAQTDYVPMVASLAALDHVNDPVRRSVIAAGATALLGMNEPSARKNESAATSAARWPEYERLATVRSPQLRLVSPAPGGLSLAKGQQWLRHFLGNCSGCRVDVIAVHFYECNGSTAKTAAAAADATVMFLDEVYAAFGKPIWLTEFNCGDGDPENNQLANQTAANHLRYMSAVLPKLEVHPHLERYSWFQTWQRNTPSQPGHNPGCALVSEDQSRLTPLGKFYDAFTSTGITAHLPRR